MITEDVGDEALRAVTTIDGGDIDRYPERTELLLIEHIVLRVEAEGHIRGDALLLQCLRQCVHRWYTDTAAGDDRVLRDIPKVIAVAEAGQCSQVLARLHEAQILGALTDDLVDQGQLSLAPVAHGNRAMS